MEVQWYDSFMPKFNGILGPVPKYTIEKIISNQQEILDHVGKLTTVNQLVEAVEKEQERNSERVSDLLNQVQELRAAKKKLEESKAIQPVSKKDTTVSKIVTFKSRKKVELHVALLTFLLVLAMALGGTGVAIFLN